MSSNSCPSLKSLSNLTETWGNSETQDFHPQDCPQHWPMPPAALGLQQPAAMPCSKHTAASKAQGNLMDQGHTTFQHLPMCIQAHNASLCGRKALPCCWHIAPDMLFPATGNSASMATKIPAEKFGKCQCETHHSKSILYQILTKSMEVRPSGTSSTAVPTAPKEAKAALVWAGEELSWKHQKPHAEKLLKCCWRLQLLLETYLLFITCLGRISLSSYNRTGPLFLSWAWHKKGWILTWERFQPLVYWKKSSSVSLWHLWMNWAAHQQEHL